MNEDDIDVEELDETGDPPVPPELIEIHVELEKHGMSPKEFKSAFSNS